MSEHLYLYYQIAMRSLFQFGPLTIENSTRRPNPTIPIQVAPAVSFPAVFRTHGKNSVSSSAGTTTISLLLDVAPRLRLRRVVASQASPTLPCGLGDPACRSASTTHGESRLRKLLIPVEFVAHAGATILARKPTFGTLFLDSFPRWQIDRKSVV